MSEQNPKFPRPKVLAADLEDPVVDELVKAGFNVKAGTFGNPFPVDRSGGYRALEDTGELPNHTEQEIVIVDLAWRQGSVPEEPAVPYGELGLFAKRNVGLVDPRPVAMRQRRPAFDRIYQHGGSFVIFVAPRFSGELVFARQRQGLRDLEKVHWDNWSFLSRLEAVSTTPDKGTEVVEPASGEGAFLAPFLNTASFLCTLSISADARHEWIVLATNKYEQPVAAAIAPREDTNEGWVFLLPHVSDQADLLLTLLRGMLPALSPRLFPHFEGDQWSRRDEYELPGVIDLKRQIDAAQDEARAKIAVLEGKIEEERREYGYQHELLVRNDDALVDAVQLALERLGFQDVRNVDREKEDAGDSTPKREDLQIHDSSPTLLVEVKGLGGTPKESEALQVLKYVLPRIREWDRIDVQGLSIINHQRHLPARNREHQNVFQDDVLTNAEDEFGLMTTWDLFRLVRNADRLGWTTDTLMPLFFRTGRIEPIPVNFEYVGLVGNFWEKVPALSIQLEATIGVGDLLAFEGKVDFSEQRVESLKIDDSAADRGERGQLVGIRTSLTKPEARPGSRVFRVGPTPVPS